ncbi:MAG TPA: [protein-PII] uridylyltransferase [Candidatus Margulisiibacteriota bacterium]|nr:[protein-PII] uridylyltransferase [Candidatus Margulisiibacteriota bacterium]
MNPSDVTLEALLPSTDWGRLARDYLQGVKAVLFERHQQGAPGHEIVDSYTGAMDHLICSLFDAANAVYAERFSRLDQRCTIVAQGGYGRAELNPCSDIDLLFLYPHKREPYIEYVSERILYTLWDTRLTVGNAMRNVRECVKLAAQDFKVKTALLDARYLCGDQLLFGDFAAAMERDVLKRNAERFFKEKLDENRERHERYGDSVYILEPQLKDGEGGLRDLHTALWMAKVKFKTNSIAELVQKGVITEREQEELESARDFLFRVRNALHFLSGEHQDRLTFEYQERIAADLGFRDTPTRKGVELFMRTYYLNAATINRFADEIIERCLERRRPYFGFGRARTRDIRPGVTISYGVLSVSRAEVLREDPSNMIRIFGDTQRHGVTMSNSTKRLVRAHLHLIDDVQRRHPAMVAAFFEVLHGKQHVYETLLEMHRTGVLGAFLPEFGALLCMVLHDLYHTYTVDEHSLRGVHELERLRAGAYKGIAPMLTGVMREVDRVDILFLGMILHDIGKGHGGGHSERGAQMIEDIAERLHLNTDDANQLRFLVAAHLNMSHLAQRRDIHDQRLIIEFAKRVETLDNLKKLYLLTFADMRAVGPKIWNNWHDMLLSELYLNTLDVFEREAFVEEDHLERVARVKQRIAAAVNGARPEHEVQVFLNDMPDRYFLGMAEESILHHLQLVASLDGDPSITEVKHYPEREFSEFTVVTRDRPGLFSMITGVLLAHGMDILGASINTSHTGVALDIFRISHGDQAEAVQRPQRWERLQGNLDKVLKGELDVERLVAESKRPSILGKRFVPRVPTEIEVDNEVSEHFTVLDVYTQDRAGVLFAITNSLFHLGLSIHLAKISTNVDQVLDVFYVTDADGKKIVDAERLGHIRNEIFARLAENARAQELTAPPGPPQE